jgi:hypothetical protein
VIEQNYHGEINNLVLNHPELTYKEVKKIHELEHKVNGVTGRRKAIDFEKV